MKENPFGIERSNLFTLVAFKAHLFLDNFGGLIAVWITMSSELFTELGRFVSIHYIIRKLSLYDRHYASY